jgi:putative MATE family efflux protein
MEKNSKMLGSESIGKLLLKLSLPAMVAMMVQALYNFVDTIYIGRGIGTIGIAAVSVSFPIQMIIMALAQMVGIGGASIISRSLGAKDVVKAEKTLGNMLGIIAIFSIVIAVLGSIFIKPILGLFGATEAIMPYAIEYMSVIFIGNIFFSFAMTSNSVIRAEGNSKVAMISMLISGIMNIILDPIFIFGFDMGIRGAALATLLAQMTGVIYILTYFLGGKSTLHFHFKDIKFEWPILKETFSVGASAFARQAAGSILAVVLNNLLGLYGGELSIAVFGVINRLLMFTIMPMSGIAQGFLPIAGFNYGAKKYDRVKEVIKTATKVTTIFSVASYAILMIFPEILISIFTTDAELIAQAVWATRINVSVIFLVGFQIVGSSLFQAIGKAGPALLLSMSRQILFFIPIVFIMANSFGLGGIWATFPISDALAFTVTLIFVIREMKILNQTIEKQKIELRLQTETAE